VQFMTREFEAVGKKFEGVHSDLAAIERRVGFLGEVTSALVRQNGTIEAEFGQLRGAQAGQQRAIDELTRRVQRLESGNGGLAQS
jgi:hypothetical protein